MRALSLLLAVIFAACGAPSVNTDAGNDGGGGVSTDAGSNDGGSHDAGMIDAGFDADRPSITFIVGRGVQSGPSGSSRTLTTGLLYHWPDAGPVVAVTCDVIEEGFCSRSTCFPTGIPQPASRGAPNAGDVTVGSVTFVRTDAGYTQPSGANPIFQPLDSLQLSAAGGTDIPAAMVTLIAPNEPALVIDSADGTLHLQAGDTLLELSENPTGSISFSLGQNLSDGGADRVYCEWPAATRTLGISRSMFHGRTGPASVTFNTLGRASVNAGGATLGLQTQSTLLTRDGGVFRDAIFE